MRLALAILMAVAQLAGPWLCCWLCCRAPVRGTTLDPCACADTAPVCPHCVKAKTAGERHPEPKKPDGPKPAEPCHCPCGDVQLAATPATAERFDPSLVAFLIPASVETAEVVPVESFTPADRAGLRELPLLTTSDRLYTHHALRC